jgi:hypothetical protein
MKTAQTGFRCRRNQALVHIVFYVQYLASKISIRWFILYSLPGSGIMPRPATEFPRARESSTRFPEYVEMAGN